MIKSLSQKNLKKIPSVDRILNEAVIIASGFPKSVLTVSISQTLDELRKKIVLDKTIYEDEFSISVVVESVLLKAKRLCSPKLVKVINATGVILHTNLGRSPMADEAVSAVMNIASNYSNLEYDLNEGSRGSRHSHIEQMLCELTGAEAAIAVNNNAAAVLLTVNTFAKDRDVLISRGQLVEIGGAFRIPDVIAGSGAHMVEVGTTNKTRIEDYESAISSSTALLLKVHTSNYKILGFTSQPSLEELVILGNNYNIPVMEDLGSGSLIDLKLSVTELEPTVKEIIARGVDLVTFSGDKLLGGPQAGIIVGRKDFIEKIKKNPLSRAMRIDKMTLAALWATLNIYRDPQNAVKKIPALNMLSLDKSVLNKRINRLKRKIGRLDTKAFQINVMDGFSKPGGGALPLTEIPSRLFCLIPGEMSANAMEKYMRKCSPPVIVRLDNECILMDMRTVKDNEISILAEDILSMAGV